MKKVLVILAAAGLLFAMSSCSNECKCKRYVDGDLKSETTITKEDMESLGFEKCKDMNSTIELLGVKTEVKCH